MKEKHSKYMQCVNVVHLVGVIKGCLMGALLSKHLHTVPSALKMEAQVLQNVGTSLVENYTVTFQKAVCLTFPSVRTFMFHIISVNFKYVFM